MPYNPTRLPYGISLGRPNCNVSQFPNGTQYLLPASSGTLFATPNVDYGSMFIAANSGLITNFVSAGAGAEYGRLLYIKCTTGGCVVIQNSAPVVRLNNIVATTSAGSTVSFTTAGNITMLNGEVIAFIHDGTGWVMESPRFVLSTQV